MPRHVAILTPVKSINEEHELSRDTDVFTIEKIIWPFHELTSHLSQKAISVYRTLHFLSPPTGLALQASHYRPS